MVRRNRKTKTAVQGRLVASMSTPAEETISVIMTILNGAKWLDKCFESIANQTAVQLQTKPHQQQQLQLQPLSQQQQQQQQQPAQAQQKTFSAGVGVCDTFHIEVCVFDDSSCDGTFSMLMIWKERFEDIGVALRSIRNESGQPKGVGYGRNMAIAISSGAYLCFQDVDDEMLPQRIEKQYALAKRHKDAIIGSKFSRIPPHSTCRFSRWANELAPQKLALQIYTSNGPTIIMPTWLCHRSVYDRVPMGFCEDGKGTPEDLIFFYQHLDRGGRIMRVDECLLRYRYHPEATTFSIGRETIWCLRLQHLIANVLQSERWCAGFTIWNAGKQGRKLFRDLPATEKNKVKAFCDVDKKKINKCYYRHFDESLRIITHSIPIVHFTVAMPPLLICMKLDFTNGDFEANLRSLNLNEGTDYILFT